MDKLRKEALNKPQIQQDSQGYYLLRTSKNNKFPKSSKFNKGTNHEATKQKAKIAKVAKLM